MLVLADVSDTGTAEIPERFTPSLTVLAAETGLDRRTVTRHLSGLESAGWVERLRPDPVKARSQGERTRYRLSVPDDEVGAENLHVEAQDPQPGGTEPLEVGAPCDTGRGTMPLNKELTNPDQEQITTADAPRPPQIVDAEIVDEPSNLPVPVAEQNGGQILKAWIDYCTAHDVKLGKRIIGHYAAGIRDALADKFSPDLIKRALGSMLDDGIASRPSLLANRLVAIQNGPERQPQRVRQAASDRAMDEAEQALAEFEAQQNRRNAS